MLCCVFLTCIWTWLNLQTARSTISTYPTSSTCPKKERKMGGVIAPSASVTRTSVPWQILLPVDLHSSRAGRHPLQTADRNVSSSPPPSPWLESIHWCSWSYYRYAPAKCKTSICHLSAHQLSSMKTSHYATPLPVSSTSSTQDIGVILVCLRPSERKFDQLVKYHLQYVSVDHHQTCENARNHNFYQ